MKSLLFVCEDSSSINHSSAQRLKPGDRWFFGETEIIDKQNNALNIPLDNHNYRKFELDQIITYDFDELSSIANDLAEQCFLNNSNNLVISTSYSFGNNCPLLLEGLYNESNTLVGPGLFLLLSRSILTTIQDQSENKRFSLHCSWNGMLNSGEFTDMFEDLSEKNESFDMENLSPISEEFGFTSIFKVESVNSLAAIINAKRKASDWKKICHFIFTFRIFKDFNEIESGKNEQIGSVSLVSLGEGIKTRFSGQISPWNVLEVAMKEYNNPIRSSFCMLQLSRYISDYFEFPDLITIIYRFPFYINPMKLSHGKEIKFVLNMMLFHQTFVDFISLEDEKADYISKVGYIPEAKSVLSDYSNTETNQNSKYLQDFGYDSPIQINSYDKSSFFFNNELNDAPIPPPNPVSKNEKIDLEFQEYLSKCNIFTENEFSPEKSRMEENKDLVENCSNLPTQKNLKYEYDALIQEINILENTLIDKNEIIIRLEKLIEARDQIIKQNQETIRLLRQDLNNETTKLKELEQRVKMNKGDNLLNNLIQTKQKLPFGLQRTRPSTANSRLPSKNLSISNEAKTPTVAIQNNDENNISEYTKEEAMLNPALSGNFIMSDSDSDIALSKRISKRPSKLCVNIKSEGSDSDFSDNIPLTSRVQKKTQKPRKTVTNTKKTSKKSTKKTKTTTKPSSKPKRKQPIKSENDSEDDDVNRDIKKQFRDGQKYITPPNGDATRAFYESLYNENPYSIIALKYCVENGVLMGAKHTNAYKRLEYLRESGLLKRSSGGIQSEAVECLKRFDSKNGGFPKGWDH
ncbi:uncharacterized protein cubi_00520 [Cryptosporidium ubiquitum]|uniref:Uncharacterized protein n=1 Tax=Cryptosporidium ubiquitum TaxID=857276 RepID=A0A1J4MBW2_9CRYT|nr:uncharacterized protein cubi_00520 [Cryptosporidium ubiquitum]OII71713.1 hypothetical protein cubi_00520 [Cryptosporidium ubiquitum]